MKAISRLFVGLALAGALCGCQDFDDLNSNPNKTTSGNAAMLATKLMREVMTSKGILDKGYKYIQDDFLAKDITFLEPASSAYCFNNLGRTDFDELASLRNVNEMIAAAEGSDQYDSYVALSKFIRAYLFFTTTMRVGDIPYSEAGMGKSDIFFPKYDTQKDVILGILKELEEADQLFAKGKKFSGDIFYNGDCAKWRKATNAFELKILINLYKKTSDADLKVESRINEIVSGKPLMESIDDNFQIVYSNSTGQKFPLHKSQSSYTEYDLVTNVIIDKLKDLQDYRLFYYADMTPNAKKAGADPSSWDSYNGVDPYMPQSDIQRTANGGDISGMNLRYEELEGCEPQFIFSYQETNFILAEAKARGLLKGGKSAKEYYEAAIRSSMEFTDKYTPASYNHGRQMTADYISSYIASPKVAFASTLDAQIEQIIWQKYITSYCEIPFNGYFEYRRTGIPALRIAPESNENTPPSKMPVRWMYPQNELTYNGDNVREAIQRQFGGSEDNNGLMWILQ